MKTNIKIVDNLAKTDPVAPIEFLYCLQTSYNKDKLPQWCWINCPSVLAVTQITRVGTHQIDNDTFDVIITDGPEDHQIYWLGHWNDGVLKE